MLKCKTEVTYVVTAVTLTPNTRRRAGKSWTQVVTFVDLLPSPREVEVDFEDRYNLVGVAPSTKVIDVREVRS